MRAAEPAADRVEIVAIGGDPDQFRVRGCRLPRVQREAGAGRYPGDAQQLGAACTLLSDQKGIAGGSERCRTEAGGQVHGTPGRVAVQAVAMRAAAGSAAAFQAVRRSMGAA